MTFTIYNDINSNNNHNNNNNNNVGKFKILIITFSIILK